MEEQRTPGDQPITSKSPTQSLFKWLRLHEASHDRTTVHRICHTVRALPHSLHVTGFSRSYLELRPWIQSPSDRNVKRVPSLLPHLSAPNTARFRWSPKGAPPHVASDPWLGGSRIVCTQSGPSLNANGHDMFVLLVNVHQYGGHGLTKHTNLRTFITKVCSRFYPR